MVRHEIEWLLDESDDEGLQTSYRRAIRDLGFVVTLDGTLAKYPGSTHLHITKPGKSGTLELTIWPSKKSVWYSIQSRRHGEWIEQGINGIEFSRRSKPLK